MGAIEEIVITSSDESSTDPTCVAWVQADINPGPNCKMVCDFSVTKTGETTYRVTMTDRLADPCGSVIYESFFSYPEGLPHEIVTRRHHGRELWAYCGLDRFDIELDGHRWDYTPDAEQRYRLIYRGPVTKGGRAYLDDCEVVPTPPQITADVLNDVRMASYGRQR